MTAFLRRMQHSIEKKLFFSYIVGCKKKSKFCRLTFTWYFLLLVSGLRYKHVIKKDQNILRYLLSSRQIECKRFMISTVIKMYNFCIFFQIKKMPTIHFWKSVREKNYFVPLPLGKTYCAIIREVWWLFISTAAFTDDCTYRKEDRKYIPS